MSPPEPPPMQHWFVYYKLQAGAVGELEPRLRQMQREVAAASGVRARLMRRAEGGDPATLMEVYEDIGEPAGFESLLAAGVARAGLPESLLSQRRIERFVSL